MVDRDQTRRDAERLRDKVWDEGLPDGVAIRDLAIAYLALLSELEQAKRTADRWETEAQILREANERFGRNQT